MKNCFLILTILTTAFLAEASSENCGQLAQELKSMRQAHNHLLDSMSKKDKDFASVLRMQSNRIENHIPKKSDVQSLSKAADTYEMHGQKQEDLVKRYKIAADALLDKVATCLNSSN